VALLKEEQLMSNYTRPERAFEILERRAKTK